MGDYFRHARAIDRSLRWALRAAPAPIGRNLVRAADGIRFVDAREAAERPETWLALFQAAHRPATAPCPTMRCRACSRTPAASRAEDFFPTAAHRDALLRFLKPRRGLYARLSEMHDSGLLGQMIPEFKAINCRVVRDFYHKYTVDEHTLLTIRNLERLTEAARPERERFRAAARRARRARAARAVAAAITTSASGRDEDHAAESTRMARQLFERLDLDRGGARDSSSSSSASTSRCRWSRSGATPRTRRSSGSSPALVGVEERLKMLCLMTLADVEAVSRETLTPWKEELLWRLYVDTYNHLTLAYGDEVIDREQSAHSALHRAAAGGPVAPKRSPAFLEGLPRRYLQLFSPRRGLPPRPAGRAISARTRSRPGSSAATSGWELTVLTHDQPFLFSNISGVLSSFGMDILRGFAFTKPTGLIVDMFHFTDDERFLELNEGGEAQLLKTLRGRACAARWTSRPGSRAARRARSGAGCPGFAPVIHCDNESSRRYTIVEIVAENALGLLYRVSRAMSESGCDVDLVLIATEGRRAIDVFHLTRDGEKLTAGAASWK